MHAWTHTHLLRVDLFLLLAALVALGYNTSDAAAAVARIDETLPVQDIIKIALRGLSRA